MIFEYIKDIEVGQSNVDSSTYKLSTNDSSSWSNLRVPTVSCLSRDNLTPPLRECAPDDQHRERSVEKVLHLSSRSPVPTATHHHHNPSSCHGNRSMYMNDCEDLSSKSRRSPVQLSSYSSSHFPNRKHLRISTPYSSTTHASPPQTKRTKVDFSAVSLAQPFFSRNRKLSHSPIDATTSVTLNCVQGESGSNKCIAETVKSTGCVQKKDVSSPPNVTVRPSLTGGKLSGRVRHSAGFNGYYQHPSSSGASSCARGVSPAIHAYPFSPSTAMLMNSAFYNLHLLHAIHQAQRYAAKLSFPAGLPSNPSHYLPINAPFPGSNNTDLSHFYASTDPIFFTRGYSGHADQIANKSVVVSSPQHSSPSSNFSRVQHTPLDLNQYYSTLYSSPSDVRHVLPPSQTFTSMPGHSLRSTVDVSSTKSATNISTSYRSKRVDNLTPPEISSTLLLPPSASEPVSNLKSVTSPVDSVSRRMSAENVSVSVATKTSASSTMEECSVSSTVVRSTTRQIICDE